MKFMKYTSLLCLVSICALDNAFADNPPAPRPVYMTSQIQRLLNEKQEKISKLEECDGKRKGFMIAGISTIGLTAVGVGVNIAQANKSNKLSNQIADQNRELEKQQSNLANINSQISEIQSNNARRECESKAGMIFVNGQCLDKQQYEQSIAQNQNGNNNQNNNQNAQQNNTSGNIISPHDGIIGEACMDGVGVWDKYDAGEKNCLVSKNTTEIVKCGCKMKTSLNQIPVVGGANAVGGETASEKTPSNGEITGLKPIQLNSIPVPETMPTPLPLRDNSENPNRLPKVEPIKLDPKKLDSIPVTEPELAPLPQSTNTTNPNQRAKAEPIQAKARTIDSLPTAEPTVAPLPRVRPETITGYCRDEKGTGLTDEGDYCYCSAEWRNPSCSENKLFADQTGVCVGDKTARNAACDRFCRSKVAEFGQKCSLDR